MLWSAGWCLLALDYLGPGLSPWVALAAWQPAVNQWLLAAAALLFFSTAQVYAKRQQPGFGRRSLLALFSCCGVPLTISRPPRFRRVWAIAVVLCGVALGIFPGRAAVTKPLQTLLLSISFSELGCDSGWRSPADHVLGKFLAGFEILPELFVAALMVMGLYEEEKRRVEQNMLALFERKSCHFEFCRP